MQCDFEKEMQLLVQNEQYANLQGLFIIQDQVINKRNIACKVITTSVGIPARLLF